MRGALATLEKLVQIFPEDLGLKNDLGVSYLLLGDNHSARRVYEEVCVQMSLCSPQISTLPEGLMGLAHCCSSLVTYNTYNFLQVCRKGTKA